jgi:hypothetical protein
MNAPRVGGYVTYRKPGQPVRKALISWIYADGTMRVQPIVGRRTVIGPADVERAAKKRRAAAQSRIEGL